VRKFRVKNANRFPYLAPTMVTSATVSTLHRCGTTRRTTRTEASTRTGKLQSNGWSIRPFPLLYLEAVELSLSKIVSGSDDDATCLLRLTSSRIRFRRLRRQCRQEWIGRNGRQLSRRSRPNLVLPLGLEVWLVPTWQRSRSPLLQLWFVSLFLVQSVAFR
jgi:hypothetical protein